MKNAIVCLYALCALTGSMMLSGCGSSNNNNGTPGPTATVAAVPQACGTNIPAQYCTGYNTGAYGTNPYYGTYGTYGYTSYGCPYGYQPMYTGSYYSGYGYSPYGTTGYTCVAASYMAGYATGYQPYYSGYGAIQACDAYLNTCGAGLRCIATSGRFGYCSY